MTQPRAKRAPNRRATPPVVQTATAPVIQPVSAADGCTCEITIVDSDKAHELISMNTHNRNLSKSRVKNLARKMTNGEWMFTGQSHFIISRDKVLLNGQHTAHAIIEANAIIETIIVSGVDPKAFDKIDIGWKRTLANMLNVEGYHNGTTLGACIRAVEMYDSLEKAERGWTHSPNLEADELISIFETDMDGFNASATAGKYASDQARKTGVTISPSAAAAFHYIAVRDGHDPTAVDSYLHRLATDVGHDADDPALSVRRWMFSNGGGQRGVNRDRGLTILSVLIKAYRAGEAGQTLKKVYAWSRESPDYPRL